MAMFSVAEAKTQPMVKFSEKLAICPKTQPLGPAGRV